MSGLGLLFDEHVDLFLARAIRERQVGARVAVVGQGAAPSKSAPDPILLRWIEDHDFVLVTNNRSSIPVHLRDHLTEGRHVPGVLMLPKPGRLSPLELIEELLLVAVAGRPDDFRDRIAYLPISR